MAAKSIECLFYSHVWSIYELEKLGFIKTGQELIVELAVESRFAPIFDRPDKNGKGLMPLLQPGTLLDKLSTRYQSIKAPIILAPIQPLSAENQLSAISLLPIVGNSTFEKIIVLIQVNDAPLFTGAYPFMTHFSIVWDIADYPGFELAALGRTLFNQQCLNKEKWKGFFICNHPNRPLTDKIQRETILRNVLNEFPLLNVA